MMDSSKSNVVPLVVRWNLQGREGREDRQSSPRPTSVVDQVRRQNLDLEQALVSVELSRDMLDISAKDAASALRRFEQTLVNLRLSLDNQRAAAGAIGDAAAAGEAAARIRALVLHGELSGKSVLRHGLRLDERAHALLRADEPVVYPAREKT